MTVLKGSLLVKIGKIMEIGCTWTIYCVVFYGPVLGEGVFNV